MFERLRSRAAQPEGCSRSQLALGSSATGLLVGVALAAWDLETAEYLVLWLAVIVIVGLVIKRTLRNTEGWDEHDY